MSDPRPDKVAIVTEVKERLEQSPSMLVTEYRGLSVQALADLRRSLRPAGGAYKVYKNSLVRLAASEAGIDLQDHLVGPTALTFTETTPEGEAGDIVSIAKVLKEFARTHPELVVKGGMLDGEPIDAAGFGRLADLEPREVLLARLAGLIAAPMQQLAGLLQAIPRDFAYGLQALIDKGGADDAPTDDVAPTDDATADDTAADDTAADETAADETAAVDTAADDTGAVDTAAVDTAAVDTAADDAQVAETAAADTAADDAPADDAPADDAVAESEAEGNEEEDRVAETADEDGED